MIQGEAKSAFGSFAGFKTSNTTAATPSPFSFLANIKPTTSTNVPTNINPSTTKTSTTSNGTENGLGATAKLPFKQTIPLKSDDNKDKKMSVTTDEKSSEYYAKLKGLNESVTQWIKKHVDTNPFCILTPIFCDYEKHLKAIELKHGQETNKESNPDEIIVVEKKSPISLDNIQETSTNQEKKIENSIFGNTSATTLSAWKPEKSIFGSTSNKKLIFSTEPKVENKSSLLSASQPSSLFSKPSTTEEKEEDKPAETKPTTVFPSATFSFGQSSSTPSSAGFSFGG